MRLFLSMLMVSALIFGCSGDDKSTTDEEQSPAADNKNTVSSQQAAPDTLANGEPKFIEVQHILISFQGRGTKATRSQSEAHLLAIEVLAKAQSGEDFDELVKQYTDDAFPGRYKMTNLGVPPNPALGMAYPRDQMVPAFGNVGFKLEIGEIGQLRCAHEPVRLAYY